MAQADLPPGIERSPSAGKTVAISGTVALAIEHLMQVFGHDIWGWMWMTTDVAGDIMVVAVAGAAWIMHEMQRQKENRVSITTPTNGVES